MGSQEKEMARVAIAREMAVKDGQEWDKLTQVMTNAYLHNADLVIKQTILVTSQPEVPVVKKFVCPVCKDTGKVGPRFCYECNPTGLREDIIRPEPVAEEVPEVVLTLTDAKVSEVVVTVSEELPMESGESVTVEADCSGLMVPDMVGPTDQEALTSPHPKPREGQYYCSRCNICHYADKGVGKRHLKYKAE